ncbi:MAG TPA: hypothetical protein VF711_02760 [Acidimicrobiales bacterium]|jgi:hypothetical protein
METNAPQQAAEHIRVPVWAWLVVVLAMFAIYALTLENGATLKAAATTVHELFHDGRHFLGVPCH